MKIVKTRPYQEKLKSHKQSILKLYSPQGLEGTLLYSISSSGELIVWNLLAKQIQNQFILKTSQSSIETPDIRKIDCAQFSGNIVYTGYTNGDVYSWSIITSEQIDKFAHHSPVNHIQKINNRVLLTTDQYGKISLWDTVSGCLDKSYQIKGSINKVLYQEPVLTMLTNRKHIYALDLTDSNITLKMQAQSNKYYVRMFSYKNKKLLQTSNFVLECFPNFGSPAEWSILINNTWINQIYIQNQFIICACDDATLRMINTTTQKVEDSVKGHQLSINTIQQAFGKMYTGSSDCYILSWDVKQFHSRLRQRKMMEAEDLQSRKNQIYLKFMQKKKGGKAKGKSKLKKNSNSGKSKSKSKTKIKQKTIR